MNKLQYFHGNYEKGIQSYTAVVEVPTIEQLQNLMVDYFEGEQEVVAIPVGITYLSPKDQYNKKTGRQLALERCRTYGFELSSIIFNFGRTEMIFSRTDLTSPIEKITLEVSPIRTKPFLINVTI